VKVKDVINTCIKVKGLLLKPIGQVGPVGLNQSEKSAQVGLTCNVKSAGAK